MTTPSNTWFSWKIDNFHSPVLLFSLFTACYVSVGNASNQFHYTRLNIIGVCLAFLECVYAIVLVSRCGCMWICLFEVFCHWVLGSFMRKKLNFKNICYCCLLLHHHIFSNPQLIIIFVMMLFSVYLQLALQFFHLTFGRSLERSTCSILWNMFCIFIFMELYFLNMFFRL